MRDNWCNAAKVKCQNARIQKKNDKHVEFKWKQETKKLTLFCALRKIRLKLRDV